MEWTDLAQDKDQWWALVTTGMKLWVPKKEKTLVHTRNLFIFCLLQ
jgi:hypothetical protein